MFLFLHPAAYQDFRKNRKPIVDRSRPHPVVCLTEALLERKELATVEVAKGKDLSLSLSNG
jgi:hypothetical protein